MRSHCKYVCIAPIHTRAMGGMRWAWYSNFLYNDSNRMTRKTMEKVWKVVVVVMIAAMVMFTIVPYLF